MSLFVATLVLWIAFIAVTKIIGDAEKLSDLNIVQKVLVLAFAALDVVYNYTYGAVLFWEPASNDRKTLTARLKGYLREQPESWRGKLASFMCKYMIEPWDFGHCSIGDRND